MGLSHVTFFVFFQGKGLAYFILPEKISANASTLYFAVSDHCGLVVADNIQKGDSGDLLIDRFIAQVKLRFTTKVFTEQLL